MRPLRKIQEYVEKSKRVVGMKTHCFVKKCYGLMGGFILGLMGGFILGNPNQLYGYWAILIAWEMENRKDYNL